MLDSIDESQGGVPRQPTNLIKVHEVKQGPDESPTAFLEWLMEAFCQHTAYDSSNKEHKATVSMAFIDQASIRKKLQRLEELQGFSAGC